MSEYPRGNSDAEHRRLERQAARFAPLTECLFREAGIGPGQRVLDIGAGLGDVSMIAAGLVGPSGEVVGIERDPRTISRARSRAAASELRNVTFVESDVCQIVEAGPFDAVVGRFILMWLPDLPSVLRSVLRLVRSGGVVAFQEPYHPSIIELVAPLPLWSAVAALTRTAAMESGGDPDIGPTLYEMFRDAGLVMPVMHQEIPMSRNPEDAQWFVDTLRPLWPRVERLKLARDMVGDLNGLVERLQAELAASRSVVAVLASPVSIWARKP